MQLWWVVAVELVGGVLLFRSVHGLHLAGGREWSAFTNSAEFTKKQIRDGRASVDHDDPNDLNNDQKAVALWWARHLTRWGRATVLWNIAIAVALELILTGCYALGPNGRVVLIPQLVVAILTLGTQDITGRERRRAAKWLGDATNPNPSHDFERSKDSEPTG